MLPGLPQTSCGRRKKLSEAARHFAGGQLRFNDHEQEQAESHVKAALAAFGLLPEGEEILDQDEYWLWPENEEPFDLWLSLQTQWLFGPLRPTGLNYPGVEACMRMRGIRPQARRRMFEVVQMLEQVALQAWAQQN